MLSRDYWLRVAANAFQRKSAKFLRCLHVCDVASGCNAHILWHIEEPDALKVPVMSSREQVHYQIRKNVDQVIVFCPSQEKT